MDLTFTGIPDAIGEQQAAEAVEDEKVEDAVTAG